MRHRALLAWAASAAFFIVSPAGAEVFHYGNESWCGIKNVSNYEIQVGDGRAVFISNVSGSLTAASPSAGFFDVRIRQTLVGLVAANVPGPAVSTKVLAADKSNNEVDPAMFMAVAKVAGPTHVVVPLYFPFDPHVSVPGGKLRFFANSDPGATDCLDTETHLTIQWHY